MYDLSSDVVPEYVEYGEDVDDVKDTGDGRPGGDEFFSAKADV